MNLKHENNKLFQALEFVTGLVQLNLLFLLTLIPVVTLFPAIYALTAVTRQWSIHQDYGIFKSYFRFFNEAIKKYRKLGLGWTFFLIILLMDFLLIRQIETGQTALFTGLLIVSLLFISLSVFLFPILAHFEMKTKDALKLAAFSIVRYMSILFLALLLFTLLGIFVYRSPLYLLFGFSLIAFLTNKIYLQRLERAIPLVPAESDAK